MSLPTYILCPGQGAQIVGMGKDFYESSSEAKEIFDAANEVLGIDLKSYCFSGPQDELNKTDISQPAIYVTSVACFRSAVAAGFIAPEQITAFAGLSLGEYTALHLGGAFDFETGLKLVRTRGIAMQQAADKMPGGMVSILGADEAAVNRLCSQCAQGGVLTPANFNAPGQIVVSGTHSACQQFMAAAEATGFKVIPLPVAGAFHSALMQSGADVMAIELQKAKLHMPATTVYANVNAEPHTDVPSMRDLLIKQVTHPVRWEQTMQKLVVAGPARFIELAPGRVLSGLMKRISRRLPVESLATIEALGSKTSAS
jgi:[acyl-carrier-protein] S-malonyltransferase